jgi:serine O-acetyltransferase
VISSRADYRDHLLRDARAHGLDKVTQRQLLTRPTLRFQRKLRRAELLTNTARGPLGRARAAVARHRATRFGHSLGFTVPVNTTGPGLCLAHVGTVVINRKARVGADCRIHAGTNLGEGRGGAPVVGDGCYLGPGAVLVGGVELGEGCVVGANAVVTTSFPPYSVVAGVPARLLRTAERKWPVTRKTPDGQLRESGDA